MKRYVQFYNMSVPCRWNDYISTVQEACGSDSILVLDARHSRYRMNEIARECAIKYDYVGYKIMNASNGRLQQTDYDPQNVCMVNE